MQDLIKNIKEQDPDKVSVSLASSLDTVAELELLQVRLIYWIWIPNYTNLVIFWYLKIKFVNRLRACLSSYPSSTWITQGDCMLRPGQPKFLYGWIILGACACVIFLHGYNEYRLTGRATVEFTIERGDGSTFFPTAGGEPQSVAKIQVHYIFVWFLISFRILECPFYSLLKINIRCMFKKKRRVFQLVGFWGQMVHFSSVRSRTMTHLSLKTDQLEDWNFCKALYIFFLFLIRIKWVF